MGLAWKSQKTAPFVWDLCTFSPNMQPNRRSVHPPLARLRPEGLDDVPDEVLLQQRLCAPAERSCQLSFSANYLSFLNVNKRVASVWQLTIKLICWIDFLRC